LLVLGAAAAASSGDAPVATAAWARATPPGADSAAVYVTLTAGKTADRLLGASTARAAMAHLHAVDESGGLTRMRPLDGLDIPVGKSVVLGPQRAHIMLMGFDRAFVAGERFSLTLHFARGGDRAVDVIVRPATATGPSGPQPR
jgi:copper(I)-binding protein